VKNVHRINLSYFVLALLGVLFLHNLWVAAGAVKEIPYSEFQTYLNASRVEEVVIGDREIRGRLRDPVQGEPERFVTTRVEPDLADALDEKGVTYSRRIDSNLLPTILSWVIPVLLFFGLWMFLIRRVAGRLGNGGPGLMSIGKSKAKVYVETDTKVSFDDVAGVEEAKEELREIVQFLREPGSYGRLGARVPKGVLLVGPPGTGKTLLARAVAGEAGVPFFSISGSEFVEMFVGVGAARVRDLFEQARQKAPAIIFVDELDALGRARGVSGLSGGHDEKEQTLNQLLVELDGFDPASGIILLAATNRPEVLDPALLRAGRFDRQVLVDRPDKRGRAQILAVHVKRINIDPELQLEDIAGLTTGFTGADLANLVNEAAIVATRRGGERVERDDFTQALERMVAGLERRNRLLNATERRIVAYHEMGHAMMAAALPGVDPVHKVSIIPRGVGALGYTLQRPTEDRFLMTREELENKLAVLLGGRAAEHLIFGHHSTGASDDLARATDIARNMVTRFAMVPDLGNVAYEEEPQSHIGPLGVDFQRRRYSEATAREIDCAVRAFVDAAFDRSRAILEQNRPLLETVAQLLLEKETLTEDDLVQLFETLKRDPGGLREPPRIADAGCEPVNGRGEDAPVEHASR
jgi:cell division protease FtsH